MSLYPPLGYPIMHCEVCGGRVPPHAFCRRHDWPSAVWQALRDKFVNIRVLRNEIAKEGP